MAVAAVLVGVGLALAACGGAPSPGATSPGRSSSDSVVPDEFVLRDLRKAAALHLRCQVPQVRARLSHWGDSQGNVIASGCGYQVTYYVTCLADHQCSFTQL